MTFFVAAAIYDLTDPADSGQGSCEDLRTESVCVAAQSPLYYIERRCSWVPIDHEGYNGFYCRLRSYNQSWRSIIIAALIIHALSVPVLLILRSLLTKVVFRHTRVLSLKTVKELREGDDTPMQESLDLKFRIKAARDLELLKCKLFQHRLECCSSNSVSLEDFNRQWNLQEGTDEVEFFGRGFPTESSILRDLELTNRDAFEMHPRNSYRVDEEQFDSRLINILYRDFLDVTNRLILKEKWDRDHPRFSTVHRITRLLGLFGLVLVATMMSVYICYFAVRRDETVQTLWLWSCFVWFLLDFILICPFLVLYFEVFSPLRLDRSIQTIKDILVGVLSDTHSVPLEDEKKYPASPKNFNSVVFLLSAYRISQWNLKQSKVAKKISRMISQAPRHLIIESLQANNGKVCSEDAHSFPIMKERNWSTTGIYLSLYDLLRCMSDFYMILIPTTIRRCAEESVLVLASAMLVFGAIKWGESSYVLWMILPLSLVGASLIILVVVWLRYQHRSFRIGSLDDWSEESELGDVEENSTSPNHSDAKAFDILIKKAFLSDSSSENEVNDSDDESLEQNSSVNEGGAADGDGEEYRKNEDFDDDIDDIDDNDIDYDVVDEYTDDVPALLGSAMSPRNQLPISSLSERSGAGIFEYNDDIYDVTFSDDEMIEASLDYVDEVLRSAGN